MTDDEKELKKYSSLSALQDSEGGKIIIQALEKDIVSAIDSLCSKYKDGTHIELISLCSKLSERLFIMKTITRSKKNKDIILKAIKEKEL